MPADTHLTYSVPEISCDHCVVAITEELSGVAGVTSVQVDLADKRVEVDGAGLDDGAIRAAIADAGYEARP